LVWLVILKQIIIEFLSRKWQIPFSGHEPNPSFADWYQDTKRV